MKVLLQVLLIFLEMGVAVGHWTVGVVRQGNNSVTIEAETIHTCNVTYVFYNVDVTEIFQVYSAVHKLDTEHSVDVIVLLNDLGPESNFITTSTVSLIRWNRTPPYNIQNKGEVHLATGNPTVSKDACPVIFEKFEDGSYCFENTKVKEINRQLNNKTSFRRVVHARGADVLSALVTERLKWTEVIIFHDTNTELEAARLVDKLSMNGIKIIIFDLDTGTDLDHTLQDAYKRIVPLKSKINFVVLCKFDCLQTLFYKANNFDQKNPHSKTLLRQFSRWLVAVYDHYFHISATLRNCAKDLDNVAVIAFPRITAEHPEIEFRKALHNVILEIAFDHTAAEDQSNMKLVNTSDSGIRQKIISDLAQEAETWRGDSRCEGYRIDTLMWTDGGRDFNNVGYVSRRGELVVFADLFPNTKYGYNGRLFQVSTLHYEPFVIKEEKNGNVTYGGVCMELLEELARTLNFTVQMMRMWDMKQVWPRGFICMLIIGQLNESRGYNLTEPPDKTWGVPGPGNTFNGMIGQLQREEVDIVAADISIQKEREMVMDFMFPFYYGYTSVLLKKPDPNARKWRTLVDPFKWEVLMTIGICLPIASLLAFLLEKFNPFYNDPENARIAAETYGLHTFHDSFWYMYGSLLCQGGVNLPESVAGRTFVSCWWLFSIVVVGTYCGNLIAFLTVTKDKPPFETLNEMADMKGDYKWGLQEGTNWEHIFKTSTRDEFRRIGDALIEFNETDPSVFSKNFKTQLDNVKKGAYGWIGDTVVMEVEMAKDCELMMIKEKFLPLKYAFGFTNNSPHVQIFTRQMLSIHESGLLQVWKRKWWPKSKEVCAGSIIAEAKPIAIIDVQSAFYVAAGGAFIGFCAFLIELLLGYLRRKREQTVFKQDGCRTNENGNIQNTSNFA